MKQYLGCFVCAFLFINLTITSHAQTQWGDLSGQVIYDGDPPEPKLLKLPRRSRLFGVLKDESLVVNKTGKGIANVVVYLYLKSGKNVVVHGDYEKSVDEPVTLTMENGRFDPHVLLIRTGQPVRHVNKDEWGYNPRMDTLANPPL